VSTYGDVTRCQALEEVIGELRDDVASKAAEVQVLEARLTAQEVVRKDRDEQVEAFSQEMERLGKEAIMVREGMEERLEEVREENVRLKVALEEAKQVRVAVVILIGNRGRGGDGDDLSHFARLLNRSHHLGQLPPRVQILLA